MPYFVKKCDDKFPAEDINEAIKRVLKTLKYRLLEVDNSYETYLAKGLLLAPPEHTRFINYLTLLSYDYRMIKVPNDSLLSALSLVLFGKDHFDISIEEQESDAFVTLIDAVKQWVDKFPLDTVTTMEDSHQSLWMTYKVREATILRRLEVLLIEEQSAAMSTFTP